MIGNGWNDLGRDLSKMVDDAVRNRNFQSLNTSINDTIRRAFEETPLGGQNHMGGYDFKLSKDEPETTSSQGAPFTGTPNKTSDRYNDMGQTKLFLKRRKRRGPAQRKFVFGIILTVLGVVSLPECIIDLVSGIIETGTAAGALIIAALMALAGIILTIKGKAGKKLSDSFDNYIRIMAGKEYENINVLAQRSGETEKRTLSSIKKMLEKGWFFQGHLDSSEKCLMVSNNAYKQYMETLQNMKIRKEQEIREAAEAEKRGLSPEAKGVIDAGRDYIRQIRESNDAIPGVEVSDKMYKMESLVKKIFDQAEAYPENIPDLRKLMDYYLPMTIKLLKAYEELDGQSPDIDNVAKTKKEIEDTIDTLNIAFENLLDDLFRDKAWDISSDISVLNTMLAQEGLTEKNPFKS